jgi:polyribonucleotide nucleotidyltransferase
MTKVVEKEIAGRILSIETGRMAKQADGAVFVKYGDSAVLVAAMSEKEVTRDLGFFPLTIEYRERTYAAGKIPGGFFKREGRPSEKEVLTARLIDRPLRPLFPEGYKFETQIYCLVLSSDGENDPSLLGMIGASAALMISDIPWSGPISAVRIGRVDGNLVINPTVEQQAQGDLELVVAVRGNDVVMLEGSASQLPEGEIQKAIVLAAEQAALINQLQMELKKAVGRDTREFIAPSLPEGLYEKVCKVAFAEFDKIYGHSDKTSMKESVKTAGEKCILDLASSFDTDPEDVVFCKAVKESVWRAEKEFVRKKLLKDRERFDGRKEDEIRSIDCQVGVIPRTHGSALFTRGQTQALVAATLGGARDEQRIDALMGEYMKNFMLHYNFPSFSVGEVRPERGPGRREIGHGHLAEIALAAVMPEKDDFAYTVRIVSDILESNGSSSQATVCGASLCLMDAGVPIKSAVAGVALGLVSDGKDYIILSDIAGVEDHLGDMDLKVAGTDTGITAVQMDLKVEGISLNILAEALERARKDREHILGKMNPIISAARSDVSRFAPRIITLKIARDKIGKLIGPGGKNIRAICEETGVDINIEDDGSVTLLSTDADASDRALALIEGSVGSPKIGKIYDGVVSNVMNFGAFVEIMPGTDGLVHISQISNERVNEVSDVLKRGQRVRVKVTKVRDDGKIDLTMKDLEENTGEEIDGS